MKGYRGLLGVLLLGLSSVPGWSQKPDPAEVQRMMDRYIRQAEEEEKAAEARKKAAPKPCPKPAPAVNYDHEAWKSAEKCGTAACFRAYLKKHPQGQYVEMAQARLESEPDVQPAVVVERPAPPARTNQRFTDNNDGTVTDNKSGLIWLKDANCFGEQNWSTAMASAQRLSSGDCGLRDRSVAGQWRLPSKDEWETLIDKTGYPFTGVQSGYYWSSTTYRDSTGDAHIVTLNVNHVGPLAKVSANYYVWPVRGGR